MPCILLPFSSSACLMTVVVLARLLSLSLMVSLAAEGEQGIPLLPLLLLFELKTVLCELKLLGEDVAGIGILEPWAMSESSTLSGAAGLLAACVLSTSGCAFLQGLGMRNPFNPGRGFRFSVDFMSITKSFSKRGSPSLKSSATKCTCSVQFQGQRLNHCNIA